MTTNFSNQAISALRSEDCGLLKPTELWQNIAESMEDLIFYFDTAIRVSEERREKVISFTPVSVRTAAVLELQSGIEKLKEARTKLIELRDDGVFAQSKETRVSVRQRIALNSMLKGARDAVLVAYASLEDFPQGGNNKRHRRRCLELRDAIELYYIPSAYLHHAGSAIDAEPIAV
jgi:hypothetical protein